MFETLAPLIVIGAFVLLAVTSWFWGADSLSDSLTGGDGRLIRWSL